MVVKKSGWHFKTRGNWQEGTGHRQTKIPKDIALILLTRKQRRWLHDLIDTIANDWGYEMIKIDFVAWSIFAADRYYDPTVSSAEVYRKGLEIVGKCGRGKMPYT